MKKRRFNSPKRAEDVAIAKKLAIPENTEKATQWCLNTWDEWTKQRELNEDERLFGPISIGEMSEDQIRYWVPRFILEVRKKNGDEYPPNTLYQMVCGLQREVQKKRPNINFFSPLFSDLSQTLDSEMKRLKSLGLGMTAKKAEPITLEEEEKLWECGALGESDPTILLYTVFYLIGVHFALRSGSEHRRLRFKNPQIIYVDADKDKNLPCRLIYTEDVSKTNQGGLKSKKVPQKVVTYWPREDKPERCLVRLFNKYNMLCPTDRPEDAFYLKPLTIPHEDQWYSKVPLGHNILSQIVQKICKKADIIGHHTNHSLRATTATRLYQHGVDEQLIMEHTGHRSVAGVRSYKRTSDEQKQAVSNVLHGNITNTQSSMSSLHTTKGLTFNNCSSIVINLHESSHQ